MKTIFSIDGLLGSSSRLYSVLRESDIVLMGLSADYRSRNNVGDFVENGLVTVLAWKARVLTTVSE